MVFSGLLWWQVGDPLASLAAQEYWGGRDFRIGFFSERIFGQPRTLIHGGPDVHDPCLPIVLLGVAMWGIGLAGLYGVVRRVGGGIAVFTAMLVVSQGLVSWVSLGRYLLPAIGVYVVAAIWIERSRHRETLLTAAVSVSVLLLSLLMVMFGHAHWVV